MRGICIVLLSFATVTRAHAYEVITPGPAVAVGQGLARSYVTVDSQETPRALGFWLEAKALEGLPEHDAIYQVDLPASVAVPPYNHLTLDWNAHGHIPNGIYNVPHFDFHFFMITPEAREKTACDATDTLCMKQPEADKIPEHYVGTPVGIPQMGWHWVDVTSPEFNGQPFSATFIYGYYNGDVTFVEPMVARSFLTKSVNFEKEVPVPKKVQFKGYYPTRYSVNYLSPMDAYWINLTNLVWIE